MKILALDIATRTGVAFGEAGAIPKAVTVDLGKAGSQPARQARLLRLTRETIARFHPDLVVFEAAVGGPKTSHFLVGLTAIVVAQSTDLGLVPVSLHRASVRKFFLGRDPKVSDFEGLSPAHAKLEIKRLVIARCHALGWEPADGDQADAMALWAFACATRAGMTLPPPGGLF